MIPVDSETILISSGLPAEKMAEIVRPKVFAELLRQGYHSDMGYASDFYHDARWLDKHMVTLPFAFQWAYSDSGTHIGTDLHYLTGNEGMAVLDVSLDVEDGYVTLSVDVA